MPKIIDHEQRRHDIALAACRAINRHGLDTVTLAQIAREAGSTTGMLAHYFDTKWDVILAALRLMHDRLESRMAKRIASQDGNLTELLADTLPIGSERRAEAAAWLTFWGSALKHPELLEMTKKTHADWRAIVARCVAQNHPSSGTWTTAVRDEVVSSIVMFMDGLSVKGLTRAEQYPPRQLRKLLENHLQRLLAWADEQV
ncbi:TetR/AcrR family transcriptional regulator [Aestuariivirga sp.]|uniref:TetR/AcrR family transcriptional regulator n=1 Tax=Aestuariivirga sp. TaxID=2650926 RepID=UPI00391DDFE7